MKKGSIEDWLDIVPQWLSFALRFPADPRAALQPYSASGAVSKDLALLVAAGVGVAYLAIALSAPPSLVHDLSRMLRLFRGVDVNLLPPMMLLLLLVSALAVHLLAKLFAMLVGAGRPGSRWAPHLGGTVEDSVNAFLGVASVYIPLAILAFSVAVSVFDGPGRRLTMPVQLCGLLLIGALFVYVPTALATVHPKTTSAQALVTFGAAFGIAAFVVALT